MMKYTALIALMMVLTVTTVFAQEEGGRGEKFKQRRDEIRATFEQKKEDLRGTITEKREALRQKFAERCGTDDATTDEKCLAKKKRFDDMAKERVTKLTSRVFGRFEAFVARYEGFADRIQSRIDKLKEQGADTDEMQDLLDAAEKSLEDSVADIAAVKESVEDIVEDESSKGEIRALVNEAKESLKETHKAFVEAVKALKAAGKDKPENEDGDDDDSSGDSA